MRTRLAAVAVLFFAFSPLAAAATLHKCIGADGSHSYQSAPCADGQRTAWVRDAGTEPTRPMPVPVPAVAARPAPPARVALPSAAARRNPAADRCAAARREADHLRDRLWNRLDFRARSELDAKVARACRGR